MVGLQRRHWYAKAVGAPVHVPVVVVRVSVPVTIGAAVAIGDPGGPTTNGVVADVAVADPSRFVPVTVTRTVEARSPLTSV